MNTLFCFLTLFISLLSLASTQGQGYIFYRNLKNSYTFNGSMERCTGGNYMTINFGGQELQTINAEQCAASTTISLGNINQLSGRALGNYFNSSKLYWNITSKDGALTYLGSGNIDMSLIENRVKNVFFEAKSYVTSWIYNTELLYTSDITPKIITPGITNNKAVHTKSVTIVAPAFLTNNFSGNDIQWLVDNNPIDTALFKVIGLGSTLTLTYNHERSNLYCKSNRLSAKSLSANWYSESIEIKFGPNLQIGRDVLISQPSCLFDQIGNDSSKTMGVISFSPSLLTRKFNIETGNHGAATSRNHEVLFLEPSTKPLYLKTMESFEKNAVSCPQYDTIYVLPPKPLSITNTSFRDIDCFGGNASYRLQLTGHAEKDTVLLDNQLKFALDRDKPFTIPDIPKGRHTVKIKDQNGCAMDTTIVLTAKEPTQLVPGISVKHPLCRDGSGIVTISAKGGTSPYRYKFEADSDYHKTNSATRLAGSNLKPSVMDAKGCIATLKDTALRTPADFFPTATPTKHNRCYNDSTAEASISVRGNGRYVYSSDGVVYQPSASLAKLATGKLILYARNDSGCVQPAKVTIQSMPKIDLIKLSQTDVTCKGYADGSLYVQVAGGKGQKYLSGDSLTAHTNVSSAYNHTFRNLKAQAYQAIATDDSGCTQTLDFQLRARSDMQQSFGTVAPTCVLSPNGEVAVTTLQGVKPYTYQWLGQPGKTNKLTNLTQGNYIVTTTDSLSCAKTDTVQLRASIQIPVKLSGYPILCKGQKLDLDPGHLGVSYTWRKENKVVSTHRVLTVDTGGTYSVLVKDNLGCTGTDSFTVSYVPKEITPSFLMTSKAVVGDIVVIAFNNVGYQRLTWSDTIPNTVSMDTTTGKTKPYIFQQPGDYSIPMTMEMYNCRATIWKTIQILPASEKQEVEESLGIKAKLVRELGVSPNPTRGEFNLKVELNYESDASISLYSISPSHLIATKELTGKSSYTIPFDEELSQGFYMLYIKVGKETVSYRVLVTND